MTIPPTNVHRNDTQPTHHHLSNQRNTGQENRPPRLEPNPMLDLLKADPQHYEQLLSRLLMQSRQHRQPYTDSLSNPPESGMYGQGMYAPEMDTVQNHTSPPQPRQTSSQPQQRSPGLRHSFVQYLVAGGCILSALALMTDVHSLIPTASSVDFCQTVVQPEALLSRDHLAQLLTVSERSSKATVQQVISEPYCQLPSVELRAGVPAEREAYPLAFDPDTWFVVLYEEGEYAGFDFSFRK